MNYEKQLKIATAKLESTKTHRIDLLRAVSKMNRKQFDQAVLELAKERKIELAGGDTSHMTDEQIGNLLKIEDTLFVNVVWLIAVPAKARRR